jgi:Phage integrase family
MPLKSGLASARRSRFCSRPRICHRSSGCRFGSGFDACFGACFASPLRTRSSSSLVRRLRVIVFMGLSDDDFVVGQPDGSAMQPTFITHQWVKTIRATSLAHLRFHDLRHAHATHMLASGVHPKVASERLGHSKVGITLDLYSHVMPGMQEDAAALVDNALQIAMQKQTPKTIR